MPSLTMIYVLFPYFTTNLPLKSLKSRDIIHEICRNSHFRALKIQNFLRPPTMVANIFFIYLINTPNPSPPQSIWKWRR